MTKLIANKEFILSEGGIVEDRTSWTSKGFHRGIYLLNSEIKYKVKAKTFTSISSNLKKIKTKEYGKVVSTLYNVI
tara:strand:+ start:849 stop:1076 length:228 start_codon:yes stop_codon:yes gene_type:complete